MKREIKEMFDAVERGHAFTVYGKDHEPLAMVIPWESWEMMNRQLAELERQYLPPSQRVLSDPDEKLPPGSTVLNMETGEVHQEPGRWGDESS